MYTSPEIFPKHASCRRGEVNGDAELKLAGTVSCRELQVARARPYYKVLTCCMHGQLERSCHGWRRDYAVGKLTIRRECAERLHPLLRANVWYLIDIVHALVLSYLILTSCTLSRIALMCYVTYEIFKWASTWTRCRYPLHATFTLARSRCWDICTSTPPCKPRANAAHHWLVSEPGLCAICTSFCMDPCGGTKHHKKKYKGPASFRKTSAINVQFFFENVLVIVALGSSGIRCWSHIVKLHSVMMIPRSNLWLWE